ncbi:protein GAMETE EXPRESSED 1 [Phalaenopsis equestris]|uniref:protein GAMETE EXPRESSED 1 n=1 Tax=Phalaenopsis equestris TaxID=78828 RepID=UPI0009E343CB|nr:protein GAMETE EXPRESSED 1 [Phalaenopsis equestris]XP_020582882.1 protein GAMETE EXPRESSED 1 [Phalaenopsis equestris]
MKLPHRFGLLLLCLSSYTWSLSFSWPFSSTPSPPPRTNKQIGEGFTDKELKSTFSIGSTDDVKAMKLLEKAKRKLATPDTCWHRAYNQLFSGCSEIMSSNEKQERLAWMLSDCFQVDSGRRGFPSCEATGPMKNCLKRLDETEHKVFLEFYLETNSICHQLQNDAFRHNTERLVNDLVKAAHSAEDKLDIIEERSEELLRDSIKIHDSLTSVEFQTRNLADSSKGVETQIRDVLKNSEAIFEQSKDISASQMELRDRQKEMKEKIESGMTLLQDSHKILGDDMAKLKSDTSEINREIRRVGDSMTYSMQNLQSTADDIGSVTGLSLEKQKKLLEGQAAAMAGLDFLTSFQSKALEESRDNLKKLADFGHKQQEELLKRQDQIQQAHDRLIQNSQSILSAQEEFEAKQASIFTALEKLFMLHNALLTESRFIKAFFFYSCVIFLLYMLTSAKQTSRIRARLYLGLCITFVVEIAIIKYSFLNSIHQSWLLSRVWMARSSFLVVASTLILHSIFTFRDYEVLNHQLLQLLLQKVQIMEQNSGRKYLYLDCDEGETSWSGYSWIDEELQEDVEEDMEADPNYALPEEVGENSIMTTSSAGRKYYNLRPRRRKW